MATPTQVFGPEVEAAFQEIRAPRLKRVSVDGSERQVPFPFPSPGDWRDHWIYFLLLDRFHNPSAAPRFTWNQKCGARQGGTFNGVRAQLGYLQDLGVGSIWLSPVLKNPRADGLMTYHGYGVQDFLQVDARFGSDGTAATAERELIALVEEAHAHGLYVILDIILNHSGRVFDYRVAGQDRSALNFRFENPEYSIRWLNGFGQPRADWQDDLPSTGLGPDDAVWPTDLQRRDFFRRRGKQRDDAPLVGDFEDLRELVTEYLTTEESQRSLQERYGFRPVLGILIRIYQYLLARFDLDGYRIDTVKHVDVEAAEIFGNAIREFALSVGKKNFLTFGEIAADEETIARYVGRNSTKIEGFGIDAALDFPLVDALVPLAKQREGATRLREVFRRRKDFEKELISSHGEAGRYFVSFLDNHDRHERFKHPFTPAGQLTLALGLLYTLQGIPCLYYGTEQGLQGTTDGLNAFESVREALWGKTPAFDRTAPVYREVRKLAQLRQAEAPLRYGRLYFREVSGNGHDFGHSAEVGGIVAFSRILSDREVLVVANTSTTETFRGFVLVDPTLHVFRREMQVAYSNTGRTGVGRVDTTAQARFFDGSRLTGVAPAAFLFVELPPLECQILIPK